MKKLLVIIAIAMLLLSSVGFAQHSPNRTNRSPQRHHTHHDTNREYRTNNNQPPRQAPDRSVRSQHRHQPPQQQPDQASSPKRPGDRGVQSPFKNFDSSQQDAHFWQQKTAGKMITPPTTPAPVPVQITSAASDSPASNVGVPNTASLAELSISDVANIVDTFLGIVPLIQ